MLQWLAAEMYFFGIEENGEKMSPNACDLKIHSNWMQTFFNTHAGWWGYMGILKEFPPGNEHVSSREMQQSPALGRPVITLQEVGFQALTMKTQ